MFTDFQWCVASNKNDTDAQLARRSQRLCCGYPRDMPVPATPVINPDLSEVPGRLAAVAINMREPVTAAVAARDGGLCTSARAALMRGAEARALLLAGPVLADAAAATGLRCCCSHSDQAPSAPWSGRGLLPAWRTPASPRGHYSTVAVCI